MANRHTTPLNPGLHKRAHRPTPRPAHLAVVLAVAAMTTAHADGTATLPPIVVSAATFAQPLTSALPAVEVITRAQIDASGSHDLSTLLAQAAGIQITGAGIPGAAADTFIRGFKGVDVLMMIDGVPINPQDATGTPYLADLSADQIERIEIVRGNVSAIYGSGAIGGAILITTRRGSATPSATVSFGGGSHGTASASLEASGRIGRTQLDAGSSRYVTQGIVTTDPATSYSPIPWATDGYRNDSAHAGISQQIAPGQTVGLRAFSSDSQYTYGNGTTPSRVRQQVVQAYSDNQLSSAWTSHLTVSQDLINNEIGGSYASGYTTEVDVAEWRNVVDIGRGWTATGGLNLQQQSIATSGSGGIPSSSRHADAVFAGIDGSWLCNQLQLNLRRDDVEGYAAQNTAYLGWGRDLGAGIKAIASYSTAFNAPPLGYLYYQNYTIPNPRLRPEKARSVEAGLQWSHQADWLRATLFRTSATDQWFYNTSVDTLGDGQFQNIISSRTEGIELAGSTSLGGWSIDGNLTEQNALDTSPAADLPAGDQGLSGSSLPLTPHTLANVQIAHAIGMIRVGAGAHFTGARDDRSTYPSNHTFGGYTTFDLTASGPLRDRWSWNMRVDNLFDKRYANSYGYFGRPFGVYLGLTWRPLQ